MNMDGAVRSFYIEMYWMRLDVSSQENSDCSCSRGGTIPEITMRYVSRYLSH